MKKKYDVAIITNLLLDGSHSMRVYAQEIQPFLKHIAYFHARNSSNNKAWHIIYKHFIFPFTIPKAKVVHILDQSYAHIHLFPSSAYKITTCHDIIPCVFPSKVPLIGRLLYALYMAGLKKSDLILSDSISTKNDLVQKLQIDEKKIIVCHLGVKKVWFKDNPPHKTSFNIVHIGSMFYKNTETVIQVMIELKKVNNKYKLIKIGKLSPEQKEALAKNQVPYQELTGLSDEQVRTHYQNAAALLFPSIYEGFGLPILEAMACGCPVVCSNAGSLKELLYTGALSAEPYDVSTFTKHILSLENQATRKKHMVLGKKHAQKYYWEYCAKRLEKIYLKAIEYLK